MLTRTHILRLFAILIFLCFFTALVPLIQGCSYHKGENISITAWGPNITQAGVAFNVQPDGSAAFWVNVDQDLDGNAYLSLNGFKLKSSVSGKLITAGVPAVLYAQPGTYPLNVVDVIDGKEVKSNSVNFMVKPK